MQPRVLETAVVGPVKPPFAVDHVLSLSHLDTDRNLLVILRYLRVYSNASHQQADPFHVITAALSAALVEFYPFSGSLRRSHPNGRFELHCQLGDGVPMVSAVVGCPLSHVSDLETDDVDDSFADQLAPDPDRDGCSIRPMTLQVTRFSCGGFVLGAAIHHAITDGLGATAFFNAMAEVARGAVRIPVDPVWDRPTLLGPRKPPRVEFPFHEFLSLDRNFFPYSGSGKPVVRKCFNFKEELLDQLKGFLHNKSGLKFTTFEALGAFIWRARTRANQVPRDEKVSFAYSINIRNVVNPPLPASYWGNGCVPMYVHLTAGEVAEQPIWETAGAIKKSKHNISSEYVRSFIDFQELYYEQGINGGRRVSGFTDWRHLGHSTLDYGWGGPVAVVPLSRLLLGGVEPCFFLPGKEGLKALVQLEEDAILGFRREIEGLGNDGGLQAAGWTVDAEFSHSAEAKLNVEVFWGFLQFCGVKC